MKQKITINTNSALVVFQWQPHTVPDCKQCDQFKLEQAGGRPKSSSKNRGRPKLVESVCKTASPSWKSLQPLSTSQLLTLSSGIQLCDVTCSFCSMVVDRPVQLHCGKLACCMCIEQYTNITFPCCGEEHTSSPIVAADMIVKVIGSLLLHCSKCQIPVELKHLRQHFDSGCEDVRTGHLDQVDQTVPQILSRPHDAPPRVTERKLASSVMRQMMNSSSSSTDGLVSLPRGGQVACTCI